MRSGGIGGDEALERWCLQMGIARRLDQPKPSRQAAPMGAHRRRRRQKKSFPLSVVTVWCGDDSSCGPFIMRRICKAQLEWDFFPKNAGRQIGTAPVLWEPAKWWSERCESNRRNAVCAPPSRVTQNIVSAGCGALLLHPGKTRFDTLFQPPRLTLLDTVCSWRFLLFYRGCSVSVRCGCYCWVPARWLGVVLLLPFWGVCSCFTAVSAVPQVCGLRASLFALVGFVSAPAFIERQKTTTAGVCWRYYCGDSGLWMFATFFFY